MNYAHDIEVYPNVFTFSCEHIETGDRWYYEISVRRNDLHGLVTFLFALRDSKANMVGYNNFEFDWLVLNFILERFNSWVKLSWEAVVSFIYEFSQRIFNASKAEKFQMIKWRPIIRQIDLIQIHALNTIDDNGQGRWTSLKMLEFNMRSVSIQDLPFPPGTYLTAEQIPILAYYNMEGDVVATVKFFHHTVELIKLRDELTERFGKDFTNYSDVKIGETYFAMLLEKHTPGICYYKDENNQRQMRQTHRKSMNLRDAVFPWINFKEPEFQRIKDYFINQTITETKGVFVGLECVVDGLKFKFGLGGIHASVDAQSIYSDDEYIIRDVDVKSFYPDITIKNRIHPEHLGDVFCDIFEEMFNERQTHVKKSAMNNTLKLAMNAGGFGKTNSKYSPFYDPMHTMKITINGQLMLCLLAEGLMTIPDLKIIQANTDGVTIRVPRAVSNQVDNICRQWEAITGLELEDVNYKAMHIRDVNNYIGVFEDGDHKVYNKKSKDIPSDAVYIGRPTKFGNPFQIGKDGNREEVISKYRQWVMCQPELLKAIKEELKGKDLVCWCAPDPCHGDVLIELANPPKTKQVGVYETKQAQDQTPLGWQKDFSAWVVPLAANAALVHGANIEEYIRSPERDIMDFMLRTKTPQKSQLVLVDDAGIEHQQQRVTRYYAAHHGGNLFKLSPPTKPHTVGTFKKAQGVTDAEYFKHDPMVWTAGIHTKNQGRYVERRDGITVGWKVEPCNDIRYVNGSNINHDYYITEAHKLVDCIN